MRTQNAKRKAQAVYIERDQFYSTALREEYVRNFLTGETVVGASPVHPPDTLSGAVSLRLTILAER